VEDEALQFSVKLESGHPLVTVELSPPKGTDLSRLVERVRSLKGRVDAINVPDCQRAILKMSSLATAKILQDETGVEMIWQLTCRDRNLIALQSDLMGACAMGIRNVLALTGDPVQVGDQKDVAKQVFHLDSVRLLDVIAGLNAGRDATGTALKHGGTLFTVGSALNPLRLSNHAQQVRLKQKLERGVHFFQTQPVYDREPVERMQEILSQIADEAGLPLPKVMIGIVPPRSADAARYMNAHIAGINIPQSFIDILDRSSDPPRESILFCAEFVNSLKANCDGFHFMPVAMETRVLELLDECFAVV
jgi:methylenetetrahydrofolate reductase (NADPH)